MDPRNKRPTTRDILFQRELLERLAVEDFDQKNNHPPKALRPRDGPEK